MELVGFDGSTEKYKAVEAQIIFGSKRHTGKYCLIDDTIGIIGRDILNQVTLLFDGPEQTWSLIEPLKKDKTIA